MSDLPKNEDFQWCVTCSQHVDGHCDGCQREFEKGELQYKSQSYHYHPTAIGGSPGTRSIHGTLCVDCYRVDHKRVYPNSEVPPLPDRKS